MKNSQIVVAFTDLVLASEIYHMILELMRQHYGIAAAEWIGEKGRMMLALKGDKLPVPNPKPD